MEELQAEIPFGIQYVETYVGDGSRWNPDIGRAVLVPVPVPVPQWWHVGGPT